MVATASIFNAPDPIARPRLLWLLVVWLNPLVGPVLWWIHRRPARLR
ncbi:PLDc N-terminal domain-containing protein [Williamsia limnetica]